MSRSCCLGLAVLVCALPRVAASEIVVLDNGRFLKAEAYSVEGASARIELANGGQLTLPMVRIERVLEDEIVPDGVADSATERLEPKRDLFLGFDAAQEPPDTPYGEFIYQAAQRRNVNPSLIAAIVRAESAFDPTAVSSKGARGLMQIMPSTGRDLGVTAGDLFDAEINIDAGVRYLGRLIERYADDLPLVLAAYNAGETAVARYNGVPPFRETQEYIRRIYSFLGVTPTAPPPSGK